MAKYRVYMERTIIEYAEVDVEAESEEEAGDKAWDLACEGDVEFEVDFAPELEITDIDLVEGSAD